MVCFFSPHKQVVARHTCTSIPGSSRDGYTDTTLSHRTVQRGGGHNPESPQSSKGGGGHSLELPHSSKGGHNPESPHSSKGGGGGGGGGAIYAYVD